MAQALPPVRVFVWVPLDKSEGVVKRHFFTLLLRNAFQHRLIFRGLEDRSSGTLTVNQLFGGPYEQIVPPTIDTVTNCGHDSSIRTPICIGARAPNQHYGLACLPKAGLR